MTSAVTVADHSALERLAVQLGTDNQRERYRDHLLPEDELLALARHELFGKFTESGLKRWDGKKSLRAADARHARKCFVATAGIEALGDHISFETCAIAELSHDEYDMLKRINAIARASSEHEWCRMAGVLFIVSPRSHWATCDVCKEETVKSSALVSVRWAGRELAREYALTV